MIFYIYIIILADNIVDFIFGVNVKVNFNQFLISKQKIVFFILFLLAFSPSISATVFFNGETGFGTTIQPITTSIVPDLSLNGYFAGQFDLSSNLIFRTNVLLETEPLFGDAFLKSTPAIVTVDELSITYHGHLGTISHYLSAFIGEVNPVGSDLFLQRHFGVPAFSSDITKSQQGISGCKIYPMNGVGFSYVLQFSKNMATGLYAYYGVLETEQELTNIADGTVSTVTVDEKSINIDLRLAGAWSVINFDLAAGFELPIKENIVDVDGLTYFAASRQANLHAGLSTHIGSSYMSSLFLQAGIIKLIFEPNVNEQVLSFSDVYALVEPRFIGEKVCFSFSLFNIPKKVSSKLFYITNPLGIDISIFTPTLTTIGNASTFGVHCTLSLPETVFQIRPSLLELQIAPYAEIETNTGIFDATIKSNVLEITSWNAFIENTEVSLKYKVKL